MTKQSDKSLQQIMNEMVQNLDSIVDMPVLAENQSCSAPQSELAAFMMVDPVLANLNRQYLDAQSHCRELISRYGDNDAMAEIAADMEQSAQCAMEARLLELRRNGDVAGAVEDILLREKQEEQEERENKLKEELEEHHKTLLVWVRLAQSLRERYKTPAIFEWAALFLMFHITPLSQLKRDESCQKMVALC